MTSSLSLSTLAMVLAAGAFAGPKPVAFRLASLPASALPGQKLVLCAANIGTGNIDVQLEFIDVKSGGVLGEKTVSLKPLGVGAASQPCLTTVAGASAVSAGPAMPAMASSFANTGTGDSEPLVVGVAMVRKDIFSFREAQVTASIQVMAPDAGGVMRTVQIIPLSRTAHPADGAPASVPPTESQTTSHHK